MNLKDIHKESELTSRILEIIENQTSSHTAAVTQSDLQGAIEAIIMEAIKYGRGTKC